MKAGVCVYILMVSSCRVACLSRATASHAFPIETLEQLEKKLQDKQPQQGV